MYRWVQLYNRPAMYWIILISWEPGMVVGEEKMKSHPNGYLPYLQWVDQYIIHNMCHYLTYSNVLSQVGKMLLQSLNSFLEFYQRCLVKSNTLIAIQLEVFLHFLDLQLLEQTMVEGWRQVNLPFTAFAIMHFYDSITSFSKSLLGPPCSSSSE